MRKKLLSTYRYDRNCNWKPCHSPVSLPLQLRCVHYASNIAILSNVTRALWRPLNEWIPGLVPLGVSVGNTCNSSIGATGLRQQFVANTTFRSTMVMAASRPVQCYCNIGERWQALFSQSTSWVKNAHAICDPNRWFKLPSATQRIGLPSERLWFAACCARRQLLAESTATEQYALQTVL